MPRAVANWKRWCEYLRTVGICRKCPGRVVPPHVYCATCRKTMATAARVKRATLIREGLCGRGCGRPKDGTHASCKPCRLRACEWYRKRNPSRPREQRPLRAWTMREITQLREWRTQAEPLPVPECAERLGRTVSSVVSQAIRQRIPFQKSCTRSCS
jgi:hypothetical protein